MDKVIEGLEFNSALAYLDDVIVFGSSIDETMDRMSVVLDRLRSANLKLKAKKCLLFATQVKYLGHVISEKGVSTDPDKVRDIVNWHTPRTVKQTRSFIGMVNYYSRFVPKLAEVAHPLHQVTKKNARFIWTKECELAFQELKGLLAQAPIMAYPTRNEMFILDTDASDLGYGAVLSQMQKQRDGSVKEKAIAFASKKFDMRESKYCARRRELLAIVNMVKHFDVYLRGPTFLIRTDHASLKYLKTIAQDSLPSIFFRYIMKLEHYSYKLQIRKGVLHANADGMSRGCHGLEAGCICDKLFEYERKHNITKGMELQVDQSLLCEVEAVPIQMYTHKNCSAEYCLVQAFKIRPKYASAELASWQDEDPDIQPVKDWVKTQPDKEPEWQDISRFSAATKSYFADINRMQLVNDVLYRVWESADGVITYKQLLAPRRMREDLCKSVHDSKILAHMGRNKTIHALQHLLLVWNVQRCKFLDQNMRQVSTQESARTSTESTDEDLLGRRARATRSDGHLRTARGNTFRQQVHLGDKRSLFKVHISTCNQRTKCRDGCKCISARMVCKERPTGGASHRSRCKLRFEANT
jgi:hypothetical protein